MNFKIKAILKIIIVSVAVAFIFWPTFDWLKERFTEADTYYSHGFLVPFVSLFLIYRKRKELLNIPQSNCAAGIFVLALGLLMHLIALRWGINFISGFSLIIVLIGLFLSLWGKEVTGKNIFPLLFLIFMIPLPKILIIAVSFKMKMLTAHISTNIVNLMGIPALRMGSIVQLPKATLTVGDPCSGLRSLISLLALGILYTYVSDLSKGKKVVLFLSTVPIAIIANVFRITLLLLVAYVYGAEIATGKFHDYSGLVVFIIALAGLMAVGRILSWQKRS